MSFTEEWNWLNSYQMDAVTDESPACIVNANVGSGKTTVLIAKILYLHYEKKIPLEKMVVLTFTNKAAGEIIERLRNKEPDLTEEQVQFFGTFHSVAMRMLKSVLPENKLETAEESALYEKAEWTADFEIIDPDEEQELALRLITEHGLKVKYKNRLKKRLEQEYPNYKKGKTVSRYKDDLFLLYPLLEKEKKRQNKMSFSNLLEEGTKNLKMGKTSLPAWIIVDEVQDSDTTQLEFLEALKGTETKIFAVGDPNQVIYSFRGTTQNMFFLLKKRFQAKELSLPVNYRSNTSILEAANRFLQFGGKIQGSNGSGEKIRVKNHYDPFQEAMYLADRIQKLHAEGKRYQDIAVFYRLQRQAEVLEKMFGEQGIPYEVSVKKSWKDIPVLNWALLGSIENSGKERESEANDGTVKLMTLHASKGLEFDTVFIIGVNPGLLPIRCSNFDQEEEERRLFFVGITRAKNHLELSYYTNPGEPGVLGTYSNYLKMIPEDLLEMEDVRSEEEKRTNLKALARQARAEIRKNEEDSKACNGIEKTEKKEMTESEQSDSERSESGINKEQEAKHPKYGTGIVTSEDDMMIEVDFPNYGKKQFIKAFQEVELI
ncbi:ATP-dependent helicase [Dorea sp.]